MTDLTFESENLDLETEFPDFVCELCTQPLTYSGRGRKPKKCSASNGGNPECYGTTSARTPTRTMSSSKKVDAALAVMESFYDQLSQILMLFAPTGATELENRIAKQQARNRLSFEASPALCDRVAKWGGKGGTWAFLLSNMSMLAMVAMAAYTGTSAQMAMAAQMMQAMGNQSGNADPTGQPFDLGSIFNVS